MRTMVVIIALGMTACGPRMWKGASEETSGFQVVEPGWALTRSPEMDSALGLNALATSHQVQVGIKKQDGRWYTANFEAADSEDVENLVIDLKARTVHLGVRRSPPKSHFMMCMYGLPKLIQDKRGPRNAVFEPCDSDFVEPFYEGVGATIGDLFISLFTLPLLTKLTTERIDAAEMLDAANSSGAIGNAIERYRTRGQAALAEARRSPDVAYYRGVANAFDSQFTPSISETAHLEGYRYWFSQAKTASSMSKFISTYAASGYDPDGVLPAARDQLVQLEQQEHRDRQAQVAAAEQRAAEVAAEQAAAFRAEAVEVRIFQDNLKVGSRTNCGPILEIKSDLAKVYMPVQGYGNEHWIEIARLYEPWKGCRFVNGQYTGN